MCPFKTASFLALSSCVLFHRVFAYDDPPAPCRAEREDHLSATGRPNIVFIVADDMGYNDVGINNPEVLTPTLDSLARGGRVLNQHYSNMMCTPSRSSILTGRYPHKTHMQHFILLNTMPHCLPADVPVLPEMLQTLGYTTHLVGKWHLGFCRQSCLPTERGFNTFFGLYGGMADQVSHYTVSQEIKAYDFRDHTDSDFSVVGDHSTDVFSDRAVDIIRNRVDGQPIFLFVSYTVPHTPVQAPQSYLDMYVNVTDEMRRGTLGMITQMDDGIGRIVNALNETRQLDNTLIVFISDNGGDPIIGHSNVPYRGGKGSLWEGGTKTVALVNGPMVEDVASLTDGLFHVIDWSPTLLAIAGRPTADPEEDGVDQSDFILKGGGSRRDKFVYNIDLERPFSFGQAAIRDGDYKLIWGYEGAKDGWGDGAGQTWTVPWNMELLGLDPINDTIVRPPGMPDLALTPEEVDRRTRLMAMKAFSVSDINSGFVYLFNLQDDPYETRNLVEEEQFADKVLEMKQKVLAIISSDYVKPHSLVTADWGDEAKSLLGTDNSWSTGWCNNVTILAYPDKPCPGTADTLISTRSLFICALVSVSFILSTVL